MASGKPFKPSITATRISFSPRWLSSFMTPSQNFAPSLCTDPDSQHLLGPIPVDAQGQVHCFVFDRSLITDFDPQGVEEHHRVHRLQGPVLPLDDILQDRISHRADQIGGYFDLILLLQEAFDLAHRHSLGVHRDDLGIESSKTLLPFADELGFKLIACANFRSRWSWKTLSKLCQTGARAKELKLSHRMIKRL